MVFEVITNGAFPVAIVEVNAPVAEIVVKAPELAVVAPIAPGADQVLPNSVWELYAFGTLPIGCLGTISPSPATFTAK
jgi:hypothetical protein